MNNVPMYLLSVLREREDKLAKRCARMGVPAPTVNILRQYVSYVTSELGDRTATPMFDYEVIGASPVLAGGWRIVASVEHLSAGNIVSHAPDFHNVILDELINAPATCDHCGHNRERKRTIIVLNESGVMSRVGTACLKDFTGHNLPAVYDIWGDTDYDLSDLMSGSKVPSFSLLQVIAMAFAVISQRGWVKSQPEDNRIPTHAVTRLALGECRCAKDSDCFACMYNPSDDDFARATNAIEWISTTTETIGYLANLRIAVMSQAFDNNFALIVSLGIAYDNFINGEAKRVAREAELVARANEVRELCPIGKVIISGKVLATEAKDTDYGTRYVMTVKDSRGFIVWGSIPSALNPEVGDCVEFSASVERSDRDEYFGFFKRPTKAKILANA